MNALAENNSYLMERLSKIKEYHITKMRSSFGVVDQKPARKAKSVEHEQSPENKSLASNEDDGGFNPNDSIN